MKIFELDQAVNAAGGVLIGDSIRRAITNSVRTYMQNRGQASLKQRLAGQAVPGIALAMGVYFAYQRYKERPDDYIGMGLDLAAGVAGLGTSLAMIPLQIARDAYFDVVKDIKETIKAAGGSTTRPELLKLSGDIERDTLRDPATVKRLLGEISDAIREQIDLSMEQVRQWEKLSQSERNQEMQKRADAISPEAGQAQAARAASATKLGARYQNKSN